MYSISLLLMSFQNTLPLSEPMFAGITQHWGKSNLFIFLFTLYLRMSLRIKNNCHIIWLINMTLGNPVARPLGRQDESTTTTTTTTTTKKTEHEDDRSTTQKKDKDDKWQLQQRGNQNMKKSDPIIHQYLTQF